jgi:hypothetical protein
VQRAGEDDLWAPCPAGRFGHEPRSDQVRLLGVSGIREGQRPARLGRQQVDAIRRRGEQRLQRAGIPDVGRLDPRAPALERLELLARGRVPIVGEGDVVAGAERALGERGADVPRTEQEQRRQMSDSTARRVGIVGSVI